MSLPDEYALDALPDGAITTAEIQERMSESELPSEARFDSDMAADHWIGCVLDSLREGGDATAWQVYTQVSPDSGEDVWLKGWHFANRTGTYAFVPVPEVI